MKSTRISIPPPPGEEDKLPTKLRIEFETPDERTALRTQLLQGRAVVGFGHQCGEPPTHAPLLNLVAELENPSEMLCLKIQPGEVRQIKHWMYGERLFSHNRLIQKLYEAL